MLLSWILKWKLIGGIGVAPGLLFDAAAVSGGSKCEGAIDLVVQEGSAAVTSGGPFRMAHDSEIDCERRRSWEERKAADESCGDEDRDLEDAESDAREGSEDSVGYVKESVMVRRSRECVRRVCKVTSGARWIGWSGFMVRVCWGRVRRRRWMVWLEDC